MALPLTVEQKSLLVHRCHRYATLWTITRKDGQGGHDLAGNYRFTDHSSSIVFESKTFTPISGLAASARQKQAGMKTRNFEAFGVVDDEDETTLTTEDLRTGRLQDATVLEQLVDWGVPWVGAFYTNKYFVTELSWSGERWEAQVSGLTTLLQQSIGSVYSRTCEYRLGSSANGVRDCRFNLAGNAFLPIGSPVPATVSSTVTAVTTARVKFQANLFAFSYPDNWFRFGTLTWTSGENTGLKFEVSEHIFVGGFITLREKTLLPIAIGDAFSVYAGCDKTFAACKDKFKNVPNHGGFPTVPGIDKVLKGVS